MSIHRIAVAPVLVALLAILGIVAAGPAAAVTPTGTTASTAEAAPGGAAGTTSTVTLPDGRSYQLFTPTTPNPRPGLVVVLHGYTGEAKGMESWTGMDGSAGRNGNYVAYGQGVDRSWNAGTCCALARDAGVDDVAYLDAVLDDVQARTAVEEGRVILSGYSNGAMMSYKYACLRPQRVSTIVPVSGTSVFPCPTQAPLSVFAVHGALDVTVPWSGTRTSTAVLGGVLPSVVSVLGGVGAGNGCSGWVQDRTPFSVDRWTAQNCPSGVQVVGMRSPSMAHTWPGGAEAKNRFGVDANALIWSIAGSRWSR